MTKLPNYSEIVFLRDDVLNAQGLVDEVDLADLSAPKTRRKLCDLVPVAQTVRDRATFLRMTFPTEDVQQTLYALQTRLVDFDPAAGTILLTGRYGLGKSHVLVCAGAPGNGRSYREMCL